MLAAKNQLTLPKAAWLVSGVKDLLVLDGAFKVPIVAPEAFMARPWRFPAPGVPAWPAGGVMDPYRRCQIRLSPPS